MIDKVYILTSTLTNKTYVGHTNDLERRLKEHNAGRSTFSSRYVPWSVLHSEDLGTENEAIMKEKYLKSAAGRRWIKKTFFQNKNIG